MEEHSPPLSLEKEVFLKNELHKFIGRISNLRVRVIFMSMFYKLSNIEPFFNLTYQEFASKIKRPIRPLDIKLLYLRVREFQHIYDRVANIPVEMLDVEVIMQKFPFLSPTEAKFVETFRAEYGHYPMFALLELRLSKATKKAEKIYAMFHGIGKYKAMDREDIAQEIGLSPDRVRRYLSNRILKDEPYMMLNPDWHRYDLLDELILTRATSDYAKIKQRELLTTEFDGFLAMVNLLSHYTLCKIMNETFAIRMYAKEYNWTEGCKAIIAASKRRYDKDTDVPFLSVLPHVDSVFPETRKAIFDIMATLAFELFGIEEQKEHHFHFTKNGVDETNALVEILNNNGIPMHLWELQQTYNAQYPKWAIEDVKMLKKLLKKCDEVSACGYSGMYATNRCAAPTDIYEIVENIFLAQPDDPVHIDDIMATVHKYYPNASKRSVEDIIYYHESLRIVRLENDYYALRENYKQRSTFHSSLKILPLNRKLEYLRYARNCRYRAETLGDE